MSDAYPVSTFVRYSTRVKELHEAWAFVMDHIDRVGGAPGVEIGPVWGHFEAPPDGTFVQPEEPPMWFEVSVTGSVNGDLACGPT